MLITITLRCYTHTIVYDPELLGTKPSPSPKAGPADTCAVPGVPDLAPPNLAEA